MPARSNDVLPACKAADLKGAVLASASVALKSAFGAAAYATQGTMAVVEFFHGLAHTVVLGLQSSATRSYLSPGGGVREYTCSRYHQSEHMGPLRYSGFRTRVSGSFFRSCGFRVCVCLLGFSTLQFY